jgi:SAM-dependent methyltransferase
MAAYDGWADYYDLIHTGTEGDAEFYVGQAVKRGGATLELGCGTGRIAIPMAMSGVDVTGLDNSKAMLDICRQKIDALGRLPGSLSLVEMDMTNFELGRQFDLIVMPYRAFMHLLTPDDQRSCLKTVRRHLKADGAFIFNVWIPRPSTIAPHLGENGGAFRLAGRYPVPNEDLTVVNHYAVVYDEEHQWIIEEHTLHEMTPEGEVQRTVILPVIRRWTWPRETMLLLETSGFETEAVFGDFHCSPFDGKSTEAIYIVRKVKSP